MPYETFDDKVSLLERYVKENANKNMPTTVWEIVSLFGFSVYYVLCAVLTIPFLQPIPLNGLAITCGTIIGFSGLLIFSESKLLLPDWLKRCSLSEGAALKLCRALQYSSCFLKIVLKPQGEFLHRHKHIRGTTALIIGYCGILLALPLSTMGTNTLPSLAILVLSLSSLEEDGYGILIGYGLAIISTVYIWYTIVSPLERMMAP